MKEAGTDDLLKVKGMTRPAAETVYRALHPVMEENEKEQPGSVD